MFGQTKTYWKQVTKAHPWVGLLVRRMPIYVSSCTAAAVGIAFWIFYLTHHTDKGWGEIIWYKAFIESTPWINWWLLIYSLLMALVIVVISLHHEKSLEDYIKIGFIYTVCVVCSYTVPALYPVYTVIPRLAYHTLYSILFFLWIATDITTTALSRRKGNAANSKDNLKGRKEQDVQWESYIDATATYLNEQPASEECLAIGIAGPWGSGKTTFMRHMQSKLDGTGKYIIKEFKPWRLSEASQVNTAFFKLLESIIREAQPWTYEELLRIVRTYAKLISTVQEVPQPARALWNHLVPEKGNSISELHSKINKELNQISKQIIILIDDIDRLDNEEMFEVLRLIRISANFNKITFVVTYDKGYLAQHIFNQLSCKGEEYLKKIINLEIQLPAYEDYVLGDVLFHKIADNFPGETQLKDLRYAIQKYSTDHGNLINDYLVTFRDSERIANSFTLILKHIKHAKKTVRLNWGDLFWIEMLHYYDTVTYNQLKSNYRHLLRQSTHIPERLEAKETKDGTHPILANLFPTSYGQVRLNSIVWRSNIKSYFAYRQLDDKLMLNDFDAFLQSHPTREQVIKSVKNWMNSAKEKSFINNLSTYDYLNIHSDEANIAYLDTLLATATYYKYSSDDFKYIAGLFRALHDDYLPTHPDYLMRKEFLESELRWFISNYSGLAIWNVLLATFPLCEDKSNPYDDSRLDFDRQRKLSLDKIKELVELNFEGFKQHEGIDKLRIERIFDRNYPLHAFVTSSSYLRRCDSARQDSLVYEEYSNLLPEAVPFIFAKRKYYSEKTCEAMMKPLTGYLWEVDEPDETDFAKVRHRVEQLFGSCKNFNAFIDKHFKLSQQHIDFYLIRYGLREK